jgi:hypothetical protein
VAYTNEYGVKGSSHYNVKLLNDVDEAYWRVYGHSAHPHWINGRFFEQTKETHGILPLTKVIAEKLQIVRVKNDLGGFCRFVQGDR